MQSARRWRGSLWPRAKSGEWDVTSQTSNKLLAARRGMDADSAGGRGGHGNALRQAGWSPVVFCNAAFAGGAGYLQPRYCPHHLSLLRHMSPAGRSGAVLVADLFRRQETRAADCGGDAVAVHATVAAGTAEAAVRRRASLGRCRDQSDPALGRAW